MQSSNQAIAYRQLESLRVDAQLLDGARAEGVARAEHRREAVGAQVVGHLRRNEPDDNDEGKTGARERAALMRGMRLGHIY
eukprot:4674672-Prymnesium_polylepis.1